MMQPILSGFEILLPTETHFGAAIQDSLLGGVIYDTSCDNEATARTLANLGVDGPALQVCFPCAMTWVH